MSKYTEIHPDGQRAYQFVADTAYVRESGTKGEHKAAEYILKEAEQAAAQLESPPTSRHPAWNFSVSGFSAEKGRAGNLPAL